MLSGQIRRARARGARVHPRPVGSVLSAPTPAAPALAALVGFCVILGACGGASGATRNRTFYDWSLGDGSQKFESPHPPLNWPLESESPAFLGVSVLEGRVRFSRPRDWLLRNGSNRPDEPYIHYVSPNGYSFGIYQRRDPIDDSWSEILERYEDDLKQDGAVDVGGRVPMATLRGQGRVYSVERDVEAKQHPLRSRSREMIVRSEEHVVLVQIVFQDENLAAVDHELLRAVATIHVR